MRTLLTIGSAVVCCCGCTPEDRKAFERETARYVYAEYLSPYVATSVAGAAAPAGAPSGLTGLCLEVGWRMMIAKDNPTMEVVASLYEVPDPDRPVRVESQRLLIDQPGMTRFEMPIDK